MRELGIGIIGCGVIAPFHAGSAQKVEGASLRAVCDIIPEKAQELAAKYGNPDVYTDYKEMIKRDDLDIICICTPSGMHSEMTIAAAEAGKHVLCEKPLGITGPQMDAMIAACRKAGVKLGTIFQRRTFESSIVVKEAIEAGKLGKMVLGDAYLKYYRDQKYYESAGWRGTWEQDGGGALMNQGVHGIDLLLWMMGDVESVYSRAAALARNIEVEDTAVAVIKFKNGAFGVLEGTTSVYPGLETRLEVHGELGTVILEETKITKWAFIGETGTQTGTDEGKVGGSSDPRAIGTLGHERQMQDMINAIREDRDPLVPGEEGRKAVDFILACYESARTGKEVRL